MFYNRTIIEHYIKIFWGRMRKKANNKKRDYRVTLKLTPYLANAVFIISSASGESVVIPLITNSTIFLDISLD
jgi:hypothetical protein